MINKLDKLNGQFMYGQEQVLKVHTVPLYKKYNLFNYIYNYDLKEELYLMFEWNNRDVKEPANN